MTSPRRISLVSPGAHTIARRCRAAGQMFLEGARSGWTQQDLEAWLADAYADVTIRIAGDDDPDAPEAGLRPSAVAELIELVGIATAAGLRDLASDPAPLLDVVLRAGAVVPLVRDDGALWMPVDLPSFDIETRVLSLFATDYLLEPDAYENDLSVCASCDRVRFDALDPCPECAGAPSGVRRIETPAESGSVAVVTGRRSPPPLPHVDPARRAC